MPRQALQFSLFLFAYYAYGGTFNTYVPLYFADLGMSVAQIGVLVSLSPVMRIIGPNLWGWVADRSGRRAATLRLTASAALLSFLVFLWPTPTSSWYWSWCW